MEEQREVYMQIGVREKSTRTKGKWKITQAEDVGFDDFISSIAAISAIRGANDIGFISTKTGRKAAIQKAVVGAIRDAINEIVEKDKS